MLKIDDMVFFVYVVKVGGLVVVGRKLGFLFVSMIVWINKIE